MDKRELADIYISEVQEDIPQLTHGPGLLSLALIRACEDLLIARDEFNRYKEAVNEDRRSFLSDFLNVPREVLDSVLEETAQDRAGGEHPPVSTDPQGHPTEPQHGPVSQRDAALADLGITTRWKPGTWSVSDFTGGEDDDSPIDYVTCPNCDYGLAYLRTTSIWCPECDLEEPR